MIKNRNKARKAKHIKIRKKIIGTAKVPRVNVFKSLRNLEAQLVDDIARKTLAHSSSLSLKLPNGGNISSAKKVGVDFATKIKELKFKKIVFDRSGYIYHGRIKAFAETLREKGVKF